ncbi:terminase large subunit domain-containing protein [Aeromonas rivipollensis]|uniref:terminase large subunit domain-containing protein n=1 Tax=Aeromonas rivipollensis TaxID=948519 RepID=UPI00373AE44F
MNIQNVDVANIYAHAVVGGVIPACRYTVLACQRHLDDLKKQDEPSFPFRFDAVKANRAVAFIKLLPCASGPAAYQNLLLPLQSWQLFIVCSVFGWVRKDSGLRRFKQAYTEAPRKNGNTTLSGAITLCLLADDDQVADVRVAAPTNHISDELLCITKRMVARSVVLRDRFGAKAFVGGVRTKDGGVLKAMPRNLTPHHEPDCPSGVIVDNYQEQLPGYLDGVVIGGEHARPQVLLWMQATAGTNATGPCHAKRQAVIDMLDGTTPHDELFGIIYTIDDSDDWDSDKALAKANPNMGISVSHDFLRGLQSKASKAAIEYLLNHSGFDARQVGFVDMFKAKHLNIWPTKQPSDGGRQ